METGIKVGQKWRSEACTYEVVGRAVDTDQWITTANGMTVCVSASFLHSYCRLVNDVPKDDKLLHLWTADAASLAADMLSDLGYTFNGQSWVAPADGIQLTGRGMVGAALLTLQHMGFTWKGGEMWAPPIGMAPPFKAVDLLDRAGQHMKDRAATYDKPEGERSMAATVQAFNAQTGRDLTEAEGWLLMVNLKIVRDRQRYQPHRDSVEDLVAYGALYGEARLGGAA